MSLACEFLLIWMIVLQTYFPFSVACLEDERSYLVDFKAGLNLSSGRSLSSWRGFNCCQWEGVACDYHTSHVIRLDLNADAYGQQLSGNVRPSLFNLEHLQHLDLSGNDFKGVSISPQLSKLRRVTFLNLSSAGFGGEVPLELGNMSSLHFLDISNNLYLNSSKFDVWVRNLRSLEFLRMESVNLEMASEHWGEAVGGLVNLTHVDLSDCGLSGIIPDLLNLTHLSHLHIPYGSFPFELPSWFENASSLVSLNLLHCDINGDIPSNFMARSKLSNLVLKYNFDLKGNLSFIRNHSSSLVVLSLSTCNLIGVIPPSIANFSKLETLDFSHNSFEGSLPPSYDNLLSLVALDLTNNQLTSQIPPSLCQLLVLRELRLGLNQLSGTIPDCIYKMSSLKALTVPFNGLRGNISLQLLENLTRLQELDLSQNQFLIDVSTSWVPQFSHLEFLGLRSCNIEGELPAFLSQQYLLMELDLSNNNIVGNLPSWLWDLPYLLLLNLSNNQFEGSLPGKISHKFWGVDLRGNRFYGSLPALDFVTTLLDLSDNEFNGSIPATIGTSTFISLSRNNLTGEIPNFIFSGSDYLVNLDLSKNKLTGIIPANFGTYSQLQVLKLAQNALQGEIPEELGSLQTLRALNLNGNRLQGIIPSSIAKCTSLRLFDLGNNKFEGSIPIWIEELIDLRILNLASNKFKDRIPPQLMTLQNLQILDLSDNNLSESIPQNLSKLSAMVDQSQSIDGRQTFSYSYGLYLFKDSLSESKVDDEITIWIKGRSTPYTKIISADKFMDLSRNNLSGNIPLEMGLLKGLISLNISKNNLSGSIPKSLGDMDQLESLDFSENKLSGEIPSQLLNLTFLEVFNLSDNMLSGLIPQGKQFSTFEASSFLGNPNLHGPPLENKTRSLGYGSKDNNKELNGTIVQDANAYVMEQWWATGLGLSYGMGFAIGGTTRREPKGEARRNPYRNSIYIPLPPRRGGGSAGEEVEAGARSARAPLPRMTPLQATVPAVCGVAARRVRPAHPRELRPAQP
ncbi:receptor-like protein EIX2 [Cryptomeria japonica]|uniref:receptor-like protein EIX2 n=1 Tax=Cryptomeria japonica TaxID=3369 RepID=UPI0027DA1C2B|nr:receptor-like protein EIX2 [Cryptomeria japonica]